MSSTSQAPAPASPVRGGSPPAEAPGPKHHGPFLPLALGALGIVFGDIGTSPLYAMAECVRQDRDPVTGAMVVAHHAMPVSHDTVLGLLSLFFWALTMVVTVKYLTFVTRADNKGEGGIFALLALVPHRSGSRSRAAVALAALVGASLLYGEGIITPAISVLSAVEGLSVATHAMDHFVVPLTVVILVVLFLAQSRGTDFIGKAFGPVMAVWFVVLAVFGVMAILRYPAVLESINPWWGWHLFQVDPKRAFLTLGGVVLCITGGEALYADMGHFGRGPIRMAWLAVVFPSLLLNYLGQGAYLLEHGWVEKPFWALVPEPLIYPMVALATAATVIASQALISGAFSLTRQAVQLGYFPRVTIVHTSATNEGQIYIPEVNQALMAACLVPVLIFKESSALAAAYGIAVTGTMSITSAVYFFVVTQQWKWPARRAVPLVLLFLSIDVPFFLANAVKFFDGGWLPVVVAVTMFTLMSTWKRGRTELADRFFSTVMPLSAFLEDIEGTRPHRVRGTAVFMFSNPDGTPPVLLHHLKHNQVLHAQVVFLSILPADVPVVPHDEQLEVKDLGQGFYRVVWSTGFMETPNVPAILKRAREQGLNAVPSTTTYFLGRETLLTGGSSKMARWRKQLFALVSRNALSATSYFGLPPGRVVELGMQVDL